MSATARPPQPFAPPLGGDLRAQVAQVAAALSRKADQTSEPVYAAVLLIAPGGAVYRLTVNDAGQLQTSAVQR